MNDEVEKPSFVIPEWCNYHISEYDLALHPDIHGNPTTCPRRVLVSCLWDCGVDVRRFTWVTVKTRHRTLDGRSKNGLLYAGCERTDKEWMRSGCATMEGRIANEWDYELANDMRRLNR